MPVDIGVRRGQLMPGAEAYYAYPLPNRLQAFGRARANNPDEDPAKYLRPEELQALAYVSGGAAQEAPAGFDWAGALGIGSGGGGGTTIIQAPQLAPQPQLPRNIDEAKVYIRQHYGMYAFLLDDPKIGPILVSAAMEGWPDDRVVAELQQTDWWKQSTETSRNWDVLVNTDPGQASRLFTQATRSASAMFRHYGLQVEGNQRVLEMAVNITRQGWTEDEVKRAIVSELQWDAATGQPNPLGDTTVQVMGAAADYARPMSETQAFNYARQIEMGDIDPNAIVDQFRQSAANDFTFWAPQLESGQTVRDLANPYISTYAQMLETAPEAVNLLDPTVQRLFRSQDPNGQAQLRPLWDTQKLIMSDPTYQWDRTTGARTTALGLVDQLAGTLGFK